MSGLTDEEKMQVLHACTSKLVDIMAEDVSVRKMVMLFPDEASKLFLSGCHAGTDALDRILDMRMS
jgi:hypothetical protein